MSAMGSSGIRRRKSKRALTRLPEDELRWPSAAESPPVMWPDAGSGFEANQYSPAGQMQR